MIRKQNRSRPTLIPRLSRLSFAALARVGEVHLVVSLVDGPGRVELRGSRDRPPHIHPLSGATHSGRKSSHNISSFLASYPLLSLSLEATFNRRGFASSKKSENGAKKLRRIYL